jgi:Outer membrane protein beta-barrel domain
MSYLKVITFTIFLFLLENSSITAQTINYGLSIGFIRSSPILENEIIQYNIIPENYYSAMGIIEISSPSPIRIQTGLKYFKIGYILKYDQSDWIDFVPSPEQMTTSISYLSIPLDVNYSFSFLPELYLSAGIDLAKAISAKSYALYSNGTTKVYDQMNSHRKLNLLLFVGIGFEYNINGYTLFIEPNYSRSIKGIIRSNELSNLEIEQLSMNAGIKF